MTGPTNAIGTVINSSSPLPTTLGGTGVSATPANGQLFIGNGTTTMVAANLGGTTNQINVTNGAGTITLSIPATPTFTGLILSGLAVNSAVYTNTTTAGALTTTFPSALQPTRQILTTGTTYTKPVNVIRLFVRMVGGGGGGGGISLNGTPANPASKAGGGGGGGAYVEFWLSTTAPTGSFTIAIGASGAGGVGNSNGSNGGNTSFNPGAGAVVAHGGVGGGGSDATSHSAFTGGTGGAVTGTIPATAFTCSGAGGGVGFYIAVQSDSGQAAGIGGYGGAAGCGFGGPGGIANYPGSPASANGAVGVSGGGGAGGSISATTATTSVNGGAGGAGVMIIDEFYN